MVPEFDRPERTFQVWSYEVGMHRLILRSNKSVHFSKGEHFKTRIDVLFQGVKAMQLNMLLHGLTVIPADVEDCDKIIQSTGLLPDDNNRFYVLLGSSFKGYVVAGVVASREDDGEFYEPSAFGE
jgi:hypothetical protein